MRQIFYAGHHEAGADDGLLRPGNPLSAGAAVAGRITPAQAGTPVVDALVSALAASYAYPDRLWVRANMIASVDGAIAVQGRSGGLSGPADKLVFSVLRSLADVILVGAGTARAERYRQAQPAETWTQLRTGRPATPPIAVITRRLELDLDGPLFASAGHRGPDLPRTIVLTTEQAPEHQRAAAAKVADVVIAGPAEVSAPAAIEALAARGHRRILTEGGPTLLGGLTAARLLDELTLTISPVLEGGHDAGRVTAAPAAAARSALTGLKLAALIEDDGFLLCRYVRG